jgi:hypothetical protein
LLLRAAEAASLTSQQHRAVDLHELPDMYYNTLAYGSRVRLNHCQYLTSNPNTNKHQHIQRNVVEIVKR